MASIVKKRDRFFARIIYKDSNGKRCEKIFSLLTKQKAKANRLIKEVNARENLFKKGLITLEQIFSCEIPQQMPLTENFIEYLKDTGRKEGTISLYERTFEVTESIINISNPILIQREHGRKLLSELKNRFENFYTINGHLRNIRAYFNWLIDEGKINHFPFKIKLLTTPKLKPNYFNNSEIEQILEAAKSDHELYSRIIVHVKTGLRLNEFDNTYHYEGFIRTFDPFKHGIERDIPIDSETLKHYQWLKDNSKHISTTISKKFLKIVKDLDLYYTKSGRKRSFHALRSTFAVKTYFETQDIYRVKTLLGHSSLSTTVIYANFDLRLLEKDFGMKKNQEKQTNKIDKLIKSEPTHIIINTTNNNHINELVHNLSLN